ncbi:MAG: hypothetical protein COW84_05720 [Gammaproteobacteria bacterium CG22_combo_CG10-13_8_21_14_all_40_8]|nr:MAG: hypothetical protein COW84_05720 [Gammaproteobacteria bacterium CG22_combo_CG10-13_8_21_14_all_40_8]
MVRSVSDSVEELFGNFLCIIHLITTEDAQPGKKARWFGRGADPERSANAHHPYCSFFLSRGKKANSLGPRFFFLTIWGMLSKKNWGSLKYPLSLTKKSAEVNTAIGNRKQAWFQGQAADLGGQRGIGDGSEKSQMVRRGPMAI